MKKLALTIAIVLGLGLTTYAQKGGLFEYGDEPVQKANRLDRGPGLPGHGSNENEDAPLGGGALLLIGFGAAYALKKRNEK